MTREIKFKIWDKIDKKWYKPIFRASEGVLDDLLLTLNGDLMRHTLKGVAHESTFPNRYEKLQYTGLKDKNGKEIYEGDLLNYKRQPDDNWAATPEFDKDYQITVEFKNGGCVADNTQSCLRDYIKRTVYHPNEWTAWEVVGNIYENHELLIE